MVLYSMKTGYDRHGYEGIQPVRQSDKAHADLYRFGSLVGQRDLIISNLYPPQCRSVRFHAGRTISGNERR